MAQPMIQSCFEQLDISEWDNHLKSWKRSRLNKLEYCRRKHISYHAFNYWKKKLERGILITYHPGKIGRPKGSDTFSR